MEQILTDNTLMTLWRKCQVNHICLANCQNYTHESVKLLQTEPASVSVVL